MSPSESQIAVAGRRYISIACIACRKRKVKCDNDRPKCSNCRLYGVECAFGEDKRRTSSKSKAHTARKSRLESRFEEVPEHPDIILLNPALTSPGQALRDPTSDNLNHSMEWQAQDVNAPPFDTTYTPIEKDAPLVDSDFQYWMEGPGFAAMSAGNISTTTPELLEDSESPNDEVFDELFDELLFTNRRDSHSPDFPGLQATTSGLILPPPSSLDSSRDHDTEPDCYIGNGEPQDEVTRRLSSRLGLLRLAEDGQLRYYGATSNLHFIQNAPLSLFQPSLRSVRENGELAIAQTGLYWRGDEAYETHLINLFFAWHNPFMNSVDKTIFLREKGRYEIGESTPMYSLTLANAIFAVGAAYTSRTHPDLPGDASEFFASRAKTLLDIEMDSPTLATIQALVALSAHEAANARDSRGWLYNGMALQLLPDLGLHLNLDQEHSNTDTESDIGNLRKTLFWAVHSLDKLWASYSGRPSLSRDMQHNISPLAITDDNNWEYYVGDGQQMLFPPDTNLSAGGHVHIYLSQLATKIGDISSTLYTGVPAPLENAYSFLHSMAKELQDWKYFLPTTLQVDTNSIGTKIVLPAIIELHLQFYEAVILLHRPFVFQGIGPPCASTCSTVPTNARETCTEAASEICRLIIMYRRQYGLRRIHIQMVHVVMTAGLSHVYNSCFATGKERKSAQEHLFTCVQALGEMGQTFNSSSRGLEIITSLRHEWQNTNSNPSTRTSNQKTFSVP